MTSTMLVPEEGTISPVKIFLHMAIDVLTRYWAILMPILLIGRLVYKRYASPLRSIPGPFLASFTRLWKFRSTMSGNTHWDHLELHRRFGPAVRIAPNEVSFSSPQAARNILSAGKRFHKTDFYAVFPPPENPDIFTEIREDVHAMKKKVANVPYSMAAMRQLSPFIDDTIEYLVERIGGFCTDPEDALGSKEDGGSSSINNTTTAEQQPILDLGAWLHYFAFDVLGEVAFGRSFGFLAAGVDKEDAIRTIDNSQKYNGIVGQVPWIDAFLRRNPVCKYIPQLDPANNLITRIAREEMAKRRPFDVEREGKGAGGDGREDLLSSLIKGHLKDPMRFGEGDIFAVAHGAIFAGSDSTASTMQSFFWLVLSAPRVYATLKQELDEAVASGSIPPQGNIEWTQAQTSLPYFQACLREAMRLRPAVGLNITRYAPAPDGAVVDGQHYPAGTRLALNGWVLHRDREVFGADADFFRPERWLEDEERARSMDRYMFQFGGGAHVCIGRNLALLEINKVCPRLLRDFDFRLVNPTRELHAKATFFVVQEGLEVYISRRTPGVGDLV